jgi:hypothetical protein
MQFLMPFQSQYAIKKGPEDVYRNDYLTFFLESF